MCEIVDPPLARADRFVAGLPHCYYPSRTFGYNFWGKLFWILVFCDGDLVGQYLYLSPNLTRADCNSSIAGISRASGLAALCEQPAKDVTIEEHI